MPRYQVWIVIDEVDEKGELVEQVDASPTECTFATEDLAKDFVSYVLDAAKEY